MPEKEPTLTASPTSISPELVRKIADKVYAMWLKECQIENERRRVQPASNLARRTK